MSIATELSRLQSDRNTIRTKLVELGMATGTDNLDALALAISELVNQGAVNVTVREGDTYTIPKGYHNGSGTVAGVSSGGNYFLQEKTVTPTKKLQNVTSDEGYFGLSAVTVNPIPDVYQDVSSVNVVAENVLTGKIFVTSTGEVLTGTMANNDTVNRTLSVTTVAYTIPKGYHSGAGKVTITLEDKTVTPTKSSQEITPTNGKVLSKVTVNPIPADYITTADADVVAANILQDKVAYAKGAKVIGTMANNADVSQTIDGITKTSVAIPPGYTTGGTVSLTGDIESALSAI